MKIILGLLFILAAIVVFIVGDIFFLIVAIIDIVKNIETISFGGLLWDIILIVFREIFSFIIAIILALHGYKIIIK